MLLQLYSPAGRRLGGALKLGAGLARLACNGDWLLLCLTTSGRLKLLDVREQRSMLSTTLMPLLEDGSQGWQAAAAALRGGLQVVQCSRLDNILIFSNLPHVLHFGAPETLLLPPQYQPLTAWPPTPPPAVLDLRLSRQGWPLLTLSGHRAFVYHPGLEEWMCCVEEAYSGSPYLSTMPLQGQGGSQGALWERGSPRWRRGGTHARELFTPLAPALAHPCCVVCCAAGELAGLQAGAVAGRGVGAGVARRLLAAKPSQQQQSRALLESNLAAALCLRSPQEYRRWLGAYAQLLSGAWAGWAAWQGRSAAGAVLGAKHAV